jgi:hypothetical protein
MATSFTIAGRNNGFSKGDARAAALEAAKAYREAMAGFAAMGTMEVWYSRLDEDQLLKAMRRATAKAPKKQAKVARREEKTVRKEATKARTRDSLQALSKLGELVDGHYRIVSQPPIVIPARDLEATFGLSRDQIEDELREQFRAYRASLGDDRRQLLERFEILDMARKVVGVGSVGTLAYIVLLQGRDQHDPLFLQVKEATSSVLEGPLPKSRHQQHGERVVRAADDAGRQRHLPWLVEGDGGRHPPLLLAPAARHEGLGRRRGDDASRPHPLRPHLRVDPGTGARPLR